jgi:hypothetical protein
MKARRVSLRSGRHRAYVPLAKEVIVVFESQCKTAHGNLLAGKCPWCGRAVINSVARSLEYSASERGAK